ncbi:MAG: hypothetical protein IPO17_08615 [Flavobacteriales bacterium]|nr:hypothetical protein [Flavobacteriales bacterium]
MARSALLSGKYYSMKELARAVQRVTGKRVPQRVLSYGLLKALLPFVALWSWITGAPARFNIESIDALKNGHPNMDSSKARRELGHTTRPLDDSLRDFYQWQKERGTIR